MGRTLWVFAVSIFTFGIMAGCLEKTKPSYLETISQSRELCSLMTTDRFSVGEGAGDTGHFLPKQLEWTQSDTLPEHGALGQVTDGCELFLEISISFQEGEKPDTSCPTSLYKYLSEAERNAYLGKREVDISDLPAAPSPDGAKVRTGSVRCAIPRYKTPLACDEAAVYVENSDLDAAGWYYCEDASDDGTRTYQLRFSALAEELAIGHFVTLQCLHKTELNAKECDASSESKLGAVCTQPGFEPNPDLPIQQYHYQLSFQQSCDCMTVTEALASPDSDLPLDERQYSAHVCTQPCEDAECPSGYRCVQTFPASLAREKNIPDAYCLPDCLTDRCSGFREIDGEKELERCVTSSETAADWHCAFSSDL